MKGEHAFAIFFISTELAFVICEFCLLYALALFCAVRPYALVWILKFEVLVRPFALKFAVFKHAWIFFVFRELSSCSLQINCEVVFHNVNLRFNWNLFRIQLLLDQTHLARSHLLIIHCQRAPYLPLPHLIVNIQSANTEWEIPLKVATLISPLSNVNAYSVIFGSNPWQKIWDVDLIIGVVLLVYIEGFAMFSCCLGKLEQGGLDLLDDQLALLLDVSLNRLLAFLGDMFPVDIMIFDFLHKVVQLAQIR